MALAQLTEGTMLHSVKQVAFHIHIGQPEPGAVDVNLSAYIRLNLSTYLRKSLELWNI